MIVTNQLTKTYGSFTALADCDLSIPRGEIFGLLGPNGAGKSTLIRLLLGFLNPTRGSAEIAGFDCHRQRDDVHRISSYLPGDARLYQMMRGRQILELFCEFRDDANIETGRQIARRLELDLNRWVGLMSTGMRQKLAMAICLAAATPLLILDEPTANLDPTVRGTVMDVVLEAKRNGRTVIFSSHVLSEIEEVCDRVGILRSGKLVHVAPMSEVKLKHRIRAHVRGTLPKLPVELKSLVTVEQQRNAVKIEASGELSRVLKWLAEAPLTDMHVQPIGLRSIYDRYHASEFTADPGMPAGDVRNEEIRSESESSG